MILHPTRAGWVAVLQSAHAMLAFQIASHWGNRTTPRPAPLPEVLAATLLHDSGWDGREEPPRLSTERRPLAFDTASAEEKETVWHDSVERAALRGRYVGYLVSHHVSGLAAFRTAGDHADFQRREEARRREIRTELMHDPRYSQVLTTRADDNNRAIVRIADAISVHLCVSSKSRVQLGDMPRSGGDVPLEMRAVDATTWRLSPWPLVGRRLQIHTEGRALPSREFTDRAALESAWERAPVVRLSFQLLAPGAPAVDTPAMRV